MSIIHDALKKVQKTNPAWPTQATGSVQAPLHQSRTGKETDKINIPLLVAAICAVVAMLFAALPHFAPKKDLSPAKAVARELNKPWTAPEPSPSTIKPPSNILIKAVTGAVAIPSVPAPVRDQSSPEPKVQKPADPNDPLSSIQIEGVMDMGGKKVVLINGNVYEEGQTIYGRIIMQITFDTFSVIENGKKRTFPIKP